LSLRLFSLLLIFCSCLVVFSQSAVDRSTVTGTVFDQTGAAIAGAKVELQLAEKIQQTTVTDQSGVFRFRTVTPAKYKLIVEGSGFETSVVEFELGRQPVPPFQIQLSIAQLHQETTVTPEQSEISSETSDNLNSIAMNTEALQNLPVFDQDYVGTMSRFLDPGGVGTGGVTLIVDGVEANGVAVSASAIKEIKINQDPYSAEFSRPGRGRIEVVTKPGTSEYHGTFNFIFRDAHLNARDPFAVNRPPEQRRIYEGVFTGPVMDGKHTSFLLSVNRSEEDLQSVVFAQGLSGAIRQNVASPLRNLLVAGRIDHAISENNTFSVRYSFQNRTQVNQGVGGTTLAEAGSKNGQREHEVQFNHQIVLSPKLINQFRIIVGNEVQPAVSLSQNPKIVVLDAFVGGGAQADQLRTESHFQLTEILSYTTGRHFIKTGINVPDFSRRGINNNLNSGGTFYFSSLADYALQRPYSFTQQRGNGHLVFYEKVIGGFVQDDFHLRRNLTISAGLRYDWQNYFHDNNNFAPRLSFAYAPGKASKTAIRGGIGVFYDRTGPRPIQDELLFNGSRLALYVLPNPSFPSPFGPGGVPTTQPISSTRFEPNIRIPYILQYGARVERQLAKSLSLSVAYLGALGEHLFRSRDLNAPLPPFDGSRPDPAFGQLREIEASGRRRSNSLEVTLRGRAGRLFNGTAQYRLSKAYDDTSGISSFPANNYDLSGEWARSDFDRRHSLDLLGTINPGRLLSLGVSVSLYSGSPYSLYTGSDDFHTGIANARPPGIGRNSLNGPTYADVDLRWSHDFHLTKSTKKDGGVKATVGIDAFNVLNSVNYASFIGNLSSPFFGQAVAAQPPRRLQLSCRLAF